MFNYTDEVMTRKLSILAVVVLALAACGGDGGGSSDPAGEMPAAKFTGFGFEASVNQPFLAADIEAEIVEDKHAAGTIMVTLPQGVNPKSLKPSFVTEAGVEVFVNGVRQTSGSDAHQFGGAAAPIAYTLRSADGRERSYVVRLRFVDPVPPVVTRLNVVTDGGAPVLSKTERIKAKLTVDGQDHYAGMDAVAIEIKGRGNSTWTEPKKPYQIRFDKKVGAQPLLGLPAARKWILLANFVDNSMLTNAIAMKIGRLLDMPFTQHMMPVELTLNGQYLGLYMLTEQKEVAPNRIDIGDEGTYLELTVSDGRVPSADPNDEMHWFFNSRRGLHLPTQVKSPELEDLTKEQGLETAERRFAQIQAEFEAMEACVVSDEYLDNGCEAHLDLRSVAQFLIVQQLTRNWEVNHPKSVQLYRSSGEPYRLGPIWDFDWTFGGTSSNEHFLTRQTDALLSQSVDPLDGTRFFTRLLRSPALRQEFDEQWHAFRAEKLGELLTYTRLFAQTIQDSGAFERDYQRWHDLQDAKKPTRPRLTDATQYAGMAADWLLARAAYIDAVVQAMKLDPDSFRF